jgi:rubrerythrin
MEMNMQAQAFASQSYPNPHVEDLKRVPRRRRRGKTTLAEIVERSLQNEHKAIAMYRMAAEKAVGPVSSLFRRIAKEEEFQLDYFREWYANIPGSEDLQTPRLAADRQRLELAMEIQVSQLPEDNRAVLDFVLEQEREQRDFYLKQRQLARGKKIRAALLDLADEENIHIDLLLEAGGYPPQPRLETVED